MIPTTRALLSRLIAEPTVPRGPNLALIDFVQELLAAAGARCERFPHPDGNRAGLWVSIGPEAKGGVVLSGHTDVVPVEGQNWSSDPFTLHEQGGRLYGRGSADMKGFVAAAVRAGLIAAGRRLRRPLHLALSYDEEVGCQGVRPMLAALAGRSPRPGFCIVGEPTGMRPALGHKGKLALRAVCHGVAGHSALAPRALNALHLGAAFLQALQARQEELRRSGAQDAAYDVPYSTVHAGLMRGGTALNIVPERCEIDFEIRNLAADDPAPILAGLRADAERITAPHRDRFPTARIEISEVSGYPGLETAPDSAVMQLLARLPGGDAPPIKVAFGTEGGLFARELGLSTVICGPGSMDQGHRADEFVTLEQLDACDRMLEALVTELERAP